ncbi:Mg/Co/Ni transporter MgtE [Crossiella equi]|uniref:Mg/Co/Ni transporter MgtE n=1 Tax=Crossiella equi TaxID=130796 RepID=A0ABS5A5E9_9PSEU|nr:CBS domain-containing protein [Crossiella equi]MBP2471813.1 Mg/Co/Ni transporter MgtE [Crossiella equi]
MRCAARCGAGGLEHAVVRQGSHITGILHRSSCPRWRAGARVRDLVRPGLVCVRQDAQVWTAAALLERTGFPALPVVDRWGALMGVVVAKDLRGLRVR